MTDASYYGIKYLRFFLICKKTAPPTITRQSTITNMVTADIAVYDDDRGGIVVNVFNDYGDA